MWADFESKERALVKVISEEFYNYSPLEIPAFIQNLRLELPKVSLADKTDFTSISGDVFPLSSLVVLLQELATKYEAANAYTFEEAISLLPQELSYPPAYALEILKAYKFKQE